MPLEHYSSTLNTPDAQLIDPRFYGTGQAGEERLRAPLMRDRSYWVRTGTPAEKRFQGLPRYRTTAPAEKLYDIVADPLGYAAKTTDPTKLENLLAAKGYIGYSSPRGEWQPFAVFKPLQAHRVREYSIGISPSTKTNADKIEKLYTELEADARQMFGDINMNVKVLHLGVGIYGGVAEASPRLIIEYGGDYNTLRDKVALLTEKYKQESALISKKVLAGQAEGGTPSYLLKFDHNLTAKERGYLGRMLRLNKLGANVNNNSVLIHHVDQFSDISAEEFEDLLVGFSEKIGKKLPHVGEDTKYIQDVIWGKRK